MCLVSLQHPLPAGPHGPWGFSTWPNTVGTTHKTKSVPRQKDRHWGLIVHGWETISIDILCFEASRLVRILSGNFKDSRPPILGMPFSFMGNQEKISIWFILFKLWRWSSFCWTLTGQSEGWEMTQTIFKWSKPCLLTDHCALCSQPSLRCTHAIAGSIIIKFIYKVHPIGHGNLEVLSIKAKKKDIYGQ